jgi:hypothetical protein
MNETLQSSPPDKTEGMMAIYPVPCKDLATIPNINPFDLLNQTIIDHLQQSLNQIG